MSLERIENKLDRVDERLTSMEAIQVRQQVILDHHVARTDALETRVEQFRDLGLRLTTLQKAGAAVLALAPFLLELWRGFHGS